MKTEAQFLSFQDYRLSEKESRFVHDSDIRSAYFVRYLGRSFCPSNKVQLVVEPFDILDLDFPLLKITLKRFFNYVDEKKLEIDSKKKSQTM